MFTLGGERFVAPPTAGQCIALTFAEGSRLDFAAYDKSKPTHPQEMASCLFACISTVRASLPVFVFATTFYLSLSASGTLMVNVSFTPRDASHARHSTYRKSTATSVRVLVFSFSRRADTSDALLQGISLLSMSSGASCRWGRFVFDMLMIMIMMMMMMHVDFLVLGQKLVSHSFIQWSSRRNHAPHPESFVQDAEDLRYKK